MHREKVIEEYILQSNIFHLGGEYFLFFFLEYILR